MDDLSLKFNNLMMQEMGIDVGAGNRLYDQDTGNKLQYEGRDLVAPGTEILRNVQEFDPYNSTRMMAQMFTFFTNKLAESGEAPEFDVVYTVEDHERGRAHVEMKNDTDIIKSGSYLRDQCRYADLILQLNGDENPDLKEFDIPKFKLGVKGKGKISKKASKK